jgi:cytochrome c peroxidase
LRRAPFHSCATGDDLGDPLAAQAKGPFLNPLDMAPPSASVLRQRVAEGSYVDLSDQVLGPGALGGDPEVVYDRICMAIAAWERSPEVSECTSKFDAFRDEAKAKKLDVTRIRAANHENVV